MKQSGYGEFAAGWPVVFSSMIGIGLGLSPVPFYTVGILAPHLAKAFGWSFGAIFFGVTITTFVVILFSPVVGILSDRYGVRRVALTSLVLFGLSFMGFALSNGSIVLFYVNWGLVALVGAGTLPITWTRAVNNFFDVRKGLALGLSLLGTGLFGYLVKPFTAWVIAEHGWRAAYTAIGALPLLIAFPIAFFAFHDRGSQAPERGGATGGRHRAPRVHARHDGARGLRRLALLANRHRLSADLLHRRRDDPEPGEHPKDQRLCAGDRCGAGVHRRAFGGVRPRGVGMDSRPLLGAGRRRGPAQPSGPGLLAARPRPLRLRDHGDGDLHGGVRRRRRIRSVGIFDRALFRHEELRHHLRRPLQLLLVRRGGGTGHLRVGVRQVPFLRRAPHRRRIRHHRGRG